MKWCDDDDDGMLLWFDMAKYLIISDYICIIYLVPRINVLLYSLAKQVPNTNWDTGLVFFVGAVHHSDQQIHQEPNKQLLTSFSKCSHAKLVQGGFPLNSPLTAFGWFVVEWNNPTWGGYTLHTSAKV